MIASTDRRSHSPLQVTSAGRWCRIIHEGSFMGTGRPAPGLCVRDLYARLRPHASVRVMHDWHITPNLVTLSSNVHGTTVNLSPRMCTGCHWCTRLDGGRPATSDLNVHNLNPRTLSAGHGGLRLGVDSRTCCQWPRYYQVVAPGDSNGTTNLKTPRRPAADTGASTPDAPHPASGTVSDRHGHSHPGPGPGLSGLPVNFKFEP